MRLIIMKYELMTLKELETFLNICERHLRSIRKRATFPKAIYIGKSKVRYSKQDIVAWLENGGFGGDS